MKTFLITLTLIITITGFQCTRKMSPTENAETIMPAPALPQSNLNITVRVAKSQLNQTLNYLVNQSFSEGITIEDGYKIHTSMSGNMDMQASNNHIITTIPLNVDLTPSGIFKNNKVSGIISVQLTTQVDIFQDQLLNKTTLTSYQWIKKPVVNFLGLNIPIEPIANRIIKKYKDGICQSIDKSISENFNLGMLRSAALKYFGQPLYSTEDNIIHVFASPLELGLGPMSMTDRELHIPVFVFFESVIAELKPQELNNDPSFSIRPFFNNTSTFFLQSRIPLPYIEQLLREQIENQTYGSGVSKITVHKIGMSGKEKNLSIMLDVTGAYNGRIDLNFEPVYDADSKQIELENFQMKTTGNGKTKNVLFNLFKGFAENKLRNTIEEQINANLQDYLANIQKLLTGTEVMKGVIVSGALLNYQIKDIRFYDSRMYFNIESQLSMNAEVRYIDTDKLVLKKS